MKFYLKRHAIAQTRIMFYQTKHLNTFKEHFILNSCTDQFYEINHQPTKVIQTIILIINIFKLKIFKQLNSIIYLCLDAFRKHVLVLVAFRRCILSLQKTSNHK